MPYIALDDADIVAGKPTKEEIFQRIKDNQESFNTDIEALKQTAIIDVFDIKFGGDITNYTETEITERIPVFKAPVSATMVSFVITLLEASTSGNLEIEIDSSTDNGVNWTPLLNNPVTVTGTAIGSLSGAVDWTSVAAQSFNQGDLLRLRITGVQVDQGEFHVSIYAELG
jgi:hypothetical protein